MAKYAGKMEKFEIMVRESGDVIECHETYMEAEDRVREFEKEDLDEDTYTPDYYEIVPVEGLRDGLTIVIDGYSLRFDWIDDPEIKTDYAVVDERTEEWLTIVSECWTFEDIVSEIRDNLPGVE